MIVPAVNKVAGISTHSLTKRLTPDWAKVAKAGIISTHSLTKRLTQGLRGYRSR